MRAVGLRSEFPIVFFAASGKPPFLKTKEVGSATENKSCCARQLTLNRAGAMPSLRWGVAVFALPNNGMHRTLAARFIGRNEGCSVLRSPVMPAVGLVIWCSEDYEKIQMYYCLCDNFNSLCDRPIFTIISGWCFRSARPIPLYSVENGSNQKGTVPLSFKFSSSSMGARK